MALRAPRADAGPLALALDTRGQTCPQPLVEVRKALLRARPGERVEVRGDHPSSFREIPILLRAQGHALLLAEGDETAWRFVVERGA